MSDSRRDGIGSLVAAAGFALGAVLSREPVKTILVVTSLVLGLTAIFYFLWDRREVRKGGTVRP